MSELWTPEVITGFIQTWYDGQDPNGNDKASLPDSGKQTFRWINKGDTHAPFSAAAKDTDGNYLNQAGGVQYQTLYQPKFMQGSIQKLTIVTVGNQYYNPTNPRSEVKLKGTNGSICYIEGTAHSGGFQTVIDIGPSYGYAVGDILEDVSGGNGQGATKATFRVDEVADLGGFFFNENDSDTNFYSTSSRANSGSSSLSECSVFIAACLNDDADDTDAFFKIVDGQGQGRDITMLFGAGTGQAAASQYTQSIKYKNASGSDVLDPDTYPTDQRREGTRHVFHFDLSATVAGTFSIDGLTKSALETVLFPASFSVDIMTGGASASDVSSKTSRGAVYEVIIFNRILNAEETAKCEGYLNSKYNLQCLDVTHPFPNAWPTIENAAVTPVPAPVQGEDPAVEPVAGPIPTPDPTVTPELPVGLPTVDENLSQFYFGGAHRLSPRQPVQMVEMYLDFCDNEYRVNDGESTCGAIGAAGSECYNTKITCQDTGNFRTNSNGILPYRFSGEVGHCLTKYKAYPSIISITSAPIEIIPTKGVALRANITIKLRDFFATGSDVDPYFETRNTIALENGTYFQKLVQRNPHYINRRIVVSDGYIDHRGVEQFYGGKKYYIIDSLQLDKDVLTIKCKDPMTLADELKAKVPTPSQFSLKVDMATGNKLNQVLRINNADATAAQIQAEYGTSGFARINKEIMGYSRLSTDAHIDFLINDRGDWGTTEANQNAGDTVQKCLAYGSYAGTGDAQRINDVAYSLLVDGAKVPRTVIDNVDNSLYSWTQEKANWLAAYRIDAIFSEPKEVNKQLSQLGTMVGVNFFYDESASKIIMKAETPELDTTNIITITDNIIIEDTVKFVNSEKERISRVYYYYNMRDHVDDRDKPSSFKNLYVAIDADGEGSTEYGKESNKTIYAYAITDASTAASISQRILARFKNTPKTLTFSVDASTYSIKTGQHFYLKTKHIVNFDGNPKQLEMQVLSTQFDRNKQQIKIKAKQFRFGTVNTGATGGDDADDFDDDGSGGSGTEDDPYTGDRGSTIYLADENHITAAVTESDGAFGDGETITFTPAEGAGAEANSRNFTATYAQSGGVVQTVAVTSNAAAGALVTNVHSGYINNEILTGTSGTKTFKIRITKRARMSGAQEPYKVA